MTGKSTLLVIGGSTGIGLSMQTASRAAGACDPFTAAGRDLKGASNAARRRYCQFRADRTRRAQ